MSVAAATRRIALSWSSGKDAAWALDVLRHDPVNDVRVLLTTFNERFERVAMHGVRRSVVRAQAVAVGAPLLEIELPWPCSNADYETRMATAIATLRDEHGITHVAFGDLFLEDIRAYRVRQLADSGLEPLFPLWHEPTAPLARRMIDAGVVAYLACVDTRQLDASFAGRRFDAALLDALPATVDACGERGEFHTVVASGPAFRHAVALEAGETIERDGFAYTDFQPARSH